MRSRHQVNCGLGSGRTPALRPGVKNSRVIELHDCDHYVFIRDEARVVRELRAFMLG